MSKKSKWRKITPKPVPSQTEPRAQSQTEPRALASGVPQVGVPQVEDFSPISPAQLAANQANAQLSTGPRTEAGLAKSSKNALKSGLTGRTVLLPGDDVEEYGRFLAEIQQHHKPVGVIENELLQIVVDCHWRLRRIQELEYALYAHGERQFAGILEKEQIALQTYLTYEKQLRNLNIQEARLDRKCAKALKELAEIQSARLDATTDHTGDESDDAPFASEAEFFAALDAGYVPPRIAAQLAKNKNVKENGFVFSNGHTATEGPQVE
jgi:hypothetical protein